MLIFLAHTSDWIRRGSAHFFVLFFAIGVLGWLLQLLLSLRYRPFTGTFGGTSSVIVPVVDEDVAEFSIALSRVVAQDPLEVIVVINGPRNEPLEAVCARFGAVVRTLWTPSPGKRGALALGIAEAHGDVVVILDSDTWWYPETLVELTRPFVEPDVGGVTTQQNIRFASTSIWSRFAEWLEVLRFSYAVPAQSVLGTVGTLPGRTIAFRRDLLVEYIPTFLTERFLGVHKEISDDRCMTTWALQRGYRTVYQSTALVSTASPTTFRGFWKQQYRWANGGQYQTLRNLRWMLRHARPLAFMTLLPIIGGYMLLASIAVWAIRAASSNPPSALGFIGSWPVVTFLLAMLASWVITTAIRQSRALARRPRHLLWLGPWAFIGLFIMFPLRIFAFVTMVKDTGWGTRANAYVGTTRVPIRYRLVPPLLACSLIACFTLAGLAMEVA